MVSHSSTIVLCFYSINNILSFSIDNIMESLPGSLNLKKKKEDIRQQKVNIEQKV